MTNDAKAISAYRKHKNLFPAAEELGIPWQTLYATLRRLGEPVTGDKERWGSEKDKFAVRGERLFQDLVPSAEDSNSDEWQSKVDFIVNGYAVDVKSAKRSLANSRYKSTRYAFHLRKQLEHADFYVCLGFSEDGSNLEVAYLIPRDMIRGIVTLSIPASGKSKWNAFQVDPDSLDGFFSALPNLEE